MGGMNGAWVVSTRWSAAVAHGAAVVEIDTAEDTREDPIASREAEDMFAGREFEFAHEVAGVGEGVFVLAGVVVVEQAPIAVFVAEEKRAQGQVGEEQGGAGGG